METLYDLIFTDPLMPGHFLPVGVWDNLAKKPRTIISYDRSTGLFHSLDGIWFSGSDTHFSKEAPTQEQAEETTVVIAPPPHKCTCNIVELIQVGCQCKGV